MLSCVLIIPAALKDEADALGAALGHGPNSYSAALTTGKGVTHWGLHAFVSADFAAMLQTGKLPVDFPDADKVLAVLISSVRADYTGHFAEVCKAHGLAMAESA